jgi:uncharacterized protein YchJ
MAVRLAGAVRLESAIPLLIAKMLADHDGILNEDCSQALVRIGTPEVLEAVAEAYPTAPRAFRMYATGPLEYIHSDLAAEKCLHLLRAEQDRHVQINLAYALLSQFVPEAIEEARRLLVGQTLDFESRDLREHLIETCTIIELRFPEYDEWQANAMSEKETHRKRLEELEGDNTAQLIYALERLAGNKAETVLPQAKPFRSLEFRQDLAAAPERKQRVGRNQPCPCDSGRKFKQCCLRKVPQ